MPRKRYLQITGDEPRRSGQAYFPDSLKAMYHTNPISSDVRKRWRNQLRRESTRGNQTAANQLLFAPIVGGYNEPLTVTCVLDRILTFNTDAYLDAGWLAKDLRGIYNHLSGFDAVSVGKILSMLAQEQRNVPRPAGTNVIEWVTTANSRRYLILDDFGGWLWLAQCRDFFAKAQRARIEAARAGKRLSRPKDSLWLQISDLPWGEAPK